jgi:hypothetical protein
MAEAASGAIQLGAALRGVVALLAKVHGELTRQLEAAGFSVEAATESRDAAGDTHRDAASA